MNYELLKLALMELHRSLTVPKYWNIPMNLAHRKDKFATHDMVTLLNDRMQTHLWEIRNIVREHDKLMWKFVWESVPYSFGWNKIYWKSWECSLSLASNSGQYAKDLWGSEDARNARINVEQLCLDIMEDEKEKYNA